MAVTDTVAPDRRTPAGLRPPENPLRPGDALEPFRAVLAPPRAHSLQPGVVHDIDIAPTRLRLHPDLPAVPAWGYGRHGHVTSPGPVLEAATGEHTLVRWRNRLPASVMPHDPGAPAAALPIATAVVDDPDGDTDSVQNHLGAAGGVPEDTAAVPVGWTSVHLHGAHSRSDADGWPDNMAPAGGQQLCAYDNTDDNEDLGLTKVGKSLWYHDHAMNGTRHHVYAGLCGIYLVRDPREAQLGLPVCADEGEIPLVLQDRNLGVAEGELRLLHKTTPDTKEFFGPLTLVDGKLWPRLPLRPQVYRLRLLNASNARAYRLHLVSIDGAGTVTPHHDRVLVIGNDGGLLWRAWQLGDEQALTVAPAERLDVLVDLTGLPDGTRRYLVNSAQAPFGGDGPPPLDELLAHGDLPGRNPYPWVLRIDVDREAPTPGRPAALARTIAAAELNPAFRRLVHDRDDNAGPPELSIAGHAHHTILLAETDPPGHLFLQEIVEDPDGTIALQLPPAAAPVRYRVEGWMTDDPAPSSTRVSFYDRTALRPELGQWQVWQFVNTTGDTHPVHIHQSAFQPLGEAAGRLAFADGNGTNLYDPDTRTTSAPLVPDGAGRTYEPAEVRGWKDVLRVDPGEVVRVAIRFDVPGRYVYHCHVLEHEDTEMMRPFVVTVMGMDDGGGMMPGM